MTLNQALFWYWATGAVVTACVMGRDHSKGRDIAGPLYVIVLLLWPVWVVGLACGWRKV